MNVGLHASGPQDHLESLNENLCSGKKYNIECHNKAQSIKSIEQNF